MAAPAPRPRPSAPALSAPSIISADMVINGTLNSTGDIQIDGRVEGDVRSVGLVIGDKAEIHGEIYAEDVTVRGKVVGRIRARKVLLAATSHVEGDILHEAFAVDPAPSSKAIAAIPTIRWATMCRPMKPASCR